MSSVAGPVVCLLLAMTAVAVAQTSVGGNADRSLIEVIARYDGDSVVLRWMPGSAALWRDGLRHGYRIRRSGGTEQVIAAWDESSWRHRASESPLAQSIVRMLFDTSTPQRADSGDGALTFEMSPEEVRYGTAMLMAASDAMIAEGLGLRWVEHGVTGGEEYCVIINDPAAAATRSCVTVGTTPAPPVPQPLDARAAMDGGSVLVSWSVGRDPDLLGFHVDRTDERSGRTRRLTRAPILATELADTETAHRSFFRDTDAKVGEQYRYEVRCINGFGQMGAAAVVRMDVTPERRPLPTPANPVARQRGQCHLEITWAVPPDAEPGTCLRVERSRTLFEGYEQLAVFCGNGSGTLVDSTASRKYPFYRTVAIDPAGRERASTGVLVSFVDSLPPGPPAELHGTIDDLGVVTLGWSAPPECDVRGYHVFWANDPEHEFVPRTRTILSEPRFTDTVSIETLTRRVFFRVVAVDYTGFPSPYSHILELVRPDHVRPLAPVFLEARPEGDAVLLRWAQSQSVDVARQLVLRSVEGGPWEDCAAVTAEATRILDTSVVAGRQYAYKLFVEDSSGNRSSQAGPMTAHVPKSRAHPVVRELSGTYDGARRAVELRWIVDGELRPGDWLIVLRAQPGASLDAYMSATAGQRFFVDDDLRVSGEYSYALQIASGQWRSEVSVRAVVAVP